MSTEPTLIGDRAQASRADRFAFLIRSKGAVDNMSGDMTLTCRDCGQGFTFTAGEQDFYAGRGFSEPTRCGDCRASRRTERDRGSYSSGGGYESSAPRGPRQMFEAVCTGCGSIAQVPFQPSAEKPVYCSTCFEQRRGANTSRPGGAGGGRGRY
ncbi:MAG TPA: zinc-ribbon domain containing protein [Chloroflexota bacterium]